jgi:hypothetical protein
MLRRRLRYADKMYDKAAFWRRRIGGRVACGDTMRRTAGKAACATIRAGLKPLYMRRKRTKTLPPAWHGMCAACAPWQRR